MDVEDRGAQSANDESKKPLRVLVGFSFDFSGMSQRSMVAFTRSPERQRRRGVRFSLGANHPSTPTPLRYGGHGARRAHAARERNAVESKNARRSAQDAKLAPNLKCTGGESGATRC